MASHSIATLPTRMSRPLEQKLQRGGCGQSGDARLLRRAARGRVRPPRAHDLHLALVLETHEPGRPELRGLDAPHLLHPHHLVPHDLSPVRPVLVGLHDRHDVRLLVEEDDGLLPYIAGEGGAVGPLHPLLVEHDGAGVGVEAGVDDADLLPDELVGPDDEAEGCEGGGVVLDEVAVEHAEGAGAGHVPPGDGVGLDVER